MRVLNAVLLMLLLVLQGQLWLGEGGVQALLRHQDRRQAMETELARLEQRNDALRAEIRDLTHGTRVVEEIAREDLGYIRAGERFIRVVDAGELVR